LEDKVKRVTTLWVLLFVLLLEGMLPAQAARQPVFIYLYARMGDHVNIELTEDRIRRILPMLERYRKAHPDAHVSATILFSGAAQATTQSGRAMTRRQMRSRKQATAEPTNNPLEARYHGTLQREPERLER